MKKLLYLFFALILVYSCKEIEITKEYIENDYWDNYNNAIKINKMKVTDSTLNVLLSNFETEPNHWNIVNKIDIDSSFVAYYSGLNSLMPNKPKLSGKVYFNKDNGWKWSFNGKEVNIIGELENNTWYKFSSLTNDAFFLYVYVDETGEIHQFAVNLSNY